MIAKTFKLEAELIDKIQAAAERFDVTQGAIVRALLSLALDSERENIMRDGDLLTESRKAKSRKN